MDEYKESLKIQRDNNNAISCAKNEGIEQGLEQGIEIGVERGLEIGEHKKAVEMAIKLKSKGILISEIAELTDLSIAEIEAL